MIFVGGWGWVAKGENLSEAKANTQKDRGERGRERSRGRNRDRYRDRERDGYQTLKK